jgi:hypothetical protein
MDTNGHELIRIKPGKGLTQGEALQFRIGVGPDLVSGRSACRAPQIRNGLRGRSPLAGNVTGVSAAD